MPFRDHLLTPTNSLPSHRDLEATSPHLCIVVIGPDGPPSSSVFSLPPFPRSSALPLFPNGVRDPQRLWQDFSPSFTKPGEQGWPIAAGTWRGLRARVAAAAAIQASV